MEKHKDKSNLRKATKLCVRLLFAACLLLVLTLVFQIVKNPEAPPSIFGYQAFTVLSNSMNPSFETGDLIVVKTAASSAIHVNDVITFKESAKKYITHRVVEIGNDHGSIGFVTKGDNNNVEDEKIVSSGALIGKQVFLIPNAGFIAKFMSGSVGFVLLILLPLIGYICLEIYDRVGKSDNPKKEVEQA